MSTDARSAAQSASTGSTVTPRALALLGTATLIAGYCSTLYWVTTVAGGTAWLVASVTIGLGAGVLLRTTPERTVFRVAAVGAVAAVVLYYTSAVPSVDLDVLLRAARDTLAMLSGITVLELTAVDVWIAALVPVPVFLSTYLALRRRYVYAAAAGGWLVCFLALTGDATTIETLVGTIGAVTVVGFGELDRRDGAVANADVLVALLAIMAVLALVVPIVPSGSAGPLEPRSVGDSGASAPAAASDVAVPTALDEQLLAGDAVSAGGPINLSPDVRFVVESPTRHRWRVGALDTYTGDGWARSGADRPFEGALAGPPGEDRRVLQRYQLRAPADDVPAVSYPTAVRNLSDDDLAVTSTQTLSANGRLPAGTNYTIVSSVPTPSESTLQSAGTEYPTSIERRYTRLPNGTVPERVVNLTDQVTERASTPLDTAQAIEAYLEENKRYSQNVSAPDGTMTDSFLFEMDAGYCTYYAGSMATMLRTQDVPARVAVGYSSGQWVGNDTWVVRGTSAHAWVEVYFPEVGWIEFDPTPSGEARDDRREAIESARENDTAGTDVPASVGHDLEFEPPEPNDSSNDTDGSDGTTNDTDGTDGTGNETAQDGSSGGPSGGAYSGIGYSRFENDTVPYSQPTVPAEPDEETQPNDSGSAGQPSDAVPARAGERLLDRVGLGVLALLLVAGTVAGGHRAGVQRRLRRAGGVLWQRRVDPATDVERASERLDRVLAGRYGPRMDGETRRAYRRRLPSSLDSRVERAFDLQERARYGGEIDRETADELVGIVDDLARERLPVVGRLR